MLAVDNYGPRQIDHMWDIDHRRVLHLVRNSLWRYAELAGWIDPARLRPIENLQLTVCPFQD